MYNKQHEDDILPLIPDKEFRRYLLENFDKDCDGKLSYKEALDVTKIELVWSACGVGSLRSLEGLQYFPNLEILTCLCDDEFPITGFDVSNNRKLKSLTCTMMQLYNLDVSNNPELEMLDCCFNDLTRLDVDNNPLLKELNCSYNMLSCLHLENNTLLRDLDCGGNELSELNLTNNPELKCLDCNDNCLTSLDLRNNTSVCNLDCNDNALEELDVSMTGLDGDDSVLYCGMFERKEPESLKILYVRRGQSIPYVTENRRERNIPATTQIVYIN